MAKRIYADNAATTRLLPQVLDKMLPYLTEEYGNPSSLYSFGQTAREAVDAARAAIATCLNGRPDEVFVTSGGSEADNWAIKMAARAMAAKGKKHIISTAFEHHAVLHTLQALEKDGFSVTLLPVHENGIVRVDELRAALRPDTALVSVMFANNEIGTLQPIAAIGALCREAGVLFHTDAVQAVGHVPVDFSAMHIDMLSLSAHKFHGPKGVGCLLIRRGLRFPNLIDGGAQEKNRRAGTKIWPASRHGGRVSNRLRQHGAGRPQIAARRDRLIRGLLSAVPRHASTGTWQRLPGNVNISFEASRAKACCCCWTHGICASSGSACTSGSLDPSHVLLSIGLPHAVAHGSLRLTLSEETTDADVDAMLAIIPEIVAKLRAMSPLWEKITAGETV
ncbi:MAG: aminotransferase class V-fold PLP-dependent enzyme [Acutalibacteraceae bacterium]